MATTKDKYSPKCPKCKGKMEFHLNDRLYEGPHFYCLTANCGLLLFPVWRPVNYDVPIKPIIKF